MASDTAGEDAPSNPDRDDFAYAVVRAAAGAIPLVGASIIEFVDLVIKSPLRRRHEAWLNDVCNSLTTLSKKVERLTPKALAENEEFISVLVAALEVVSKTHSKEKLELLRNAVLNTACRVNVDGVERLMFMGLIERFTEAHIRVAKYWATVEFGGQFHEQVRESGTAGAMDYVSVAFPDFNDRPEVLDTIFGDLVTSGILRNMGGERALGQMEAITSATTGFGDRFLQFVSRPDH